MGSDDIELLSQSESENFIGSRSEFALIEIDTEEQITTLEEEYQVEILEVYENYVLANISTNQKTKLEDLGFKNRINLLQDRTILSTSLYTFDTRISTPIIPPELQIKEYETDTIGTYIIQFIGPIKQTWLEQIENLGIKICYYLPNYAYAVLMNSSLEKTVNNLPMIQWLGILQPGYKLSPQTSAGKMNIIIQNTHFFEQSLSNIENNSLIQSVSYDPYFDQYCIVANILNENITRIVRYPDVLWITMNQGY
jgi:hypothetical protein